MLFNSKFSSSEASSNSDTNAKSSTESAYIKNLKKQANNDDTGAQFELGKSYFYGKNGVKEDEKEAFYWFIMAATNESKEALEFIIEHMNKNMYAATEFVNLLYILASKKEKVYALKELEDFASGGNALSALAQFYIGKLYFESKVLKQNYKTAFKYFKQALANGHIESLAFIKEQAQTNNHIAQEILAEIYFDGIMVDKDKKEAFKWYAKADKNGSEKAGDTINKYANRGDIDAQNCLIEIYYNNGNYAKLINLADSGNNQAIKYINLIFNNSNGKAQYDIAKIYEHLNNKEEIVRWYVQSFKNGYSKSIDIIANYIEKGNKEVYGYLSEFYKNNSVNHNLNEAFNFFIKAANQGNEDAITYLKNFIGNGAAEKQYEVAQLIELNKLPQSRFLQILELYSKSAEKGNIEAIKKLAEYYYENNRKLSTSLYLKFEEKSIRQNVNIDANTKYILGEIYFNDLTKPENKEKGLNYFIQSAKAGNRQARKIIETIDIDSLKDNELCLLRTNYCKANNLKRYFFIRKHKLLLTILPAVIISLIISLIVWSAIHAYTPKGTDFQKAEIYHKRGNIGKAELYYERHYLAEAEKGDANAQLTLGTGYSSGRFSSDFDKAVYWLEKSAQQGNENAQLILGMGYFSGRFSLDLDKAVYWLEKSALQGNADAQLTLGMGYSSGRFPFDFDKAVYWLEKIAEQGNIKAGEELGKIYYKKQNYVKAKFWFEKLLEQENPDAQYYLGEIYFNGYGVKKNLKEAEKLFARSAKNGNQSAQKTLDTINKGREEQRAKEERNKQKRNTILSYLGQGYYHLAREVDKNYQSLGFDQNYLYEKSIEKFELLAKRGSSGALNMLAIIHWEQGNSNEYIKYIKKSAELRNAAAQYELSERYRNGSAVAVKKNIKLAKELMLKSAYQGYEDALGKLGDAYKYGTYGEINKKEAQMWKTLWEQSNKKEPNRISYSLTLKEIDDVTLLGVSTRLSATIRAAISCFKKAADLGDTEAKEMMKRLNDLSRKELASRARESVQSINSWFE
ncbi:MAG: hypothetical protein LBL00_05465 [Endomicrobium sp.]|nr:hypothetical protein [Endomicrobium sp.]